MKTTKQKMADAIKEARRKMHDQVQGGVTNSDMTSREMRDDIAEYFAQAALDVVTTTLIKEAYEMLKHAETLPCSSMKLEQMDFAKGVKMAADKLRG